jgi:DHA1 family purine base/nucleoside efflux pump-like MFS transporter
VVSQVGTAAAIIGVISALLISLLSMYFFPKSLLLVGLSLLVVSVIGCTFSPSFPILLVVYSLSGVAGSFVGPMAFTLIADHFPYEKRPNAISWIIVGMSSAYLIGAPIIGYISGFAGWRGSFLWFVLPVSLFGLLLAIWFLPSGKNPKTGINAGSLMQSFKAVLTNGSAVSCLVGTTLISASYMSVVSYAPSYFRERFSVPTSYASFLIMGACVFFIFGSRICGRFITRFGRKKMMFWNAALAALFIFAFFNIPNMWLSMGVRFICGTFVSIVFTSTNALTLEQVPEFRGTVMSLSQATFSLGGVLGTGLGGLIVLLSGYRTLGISHGGMMFVAMLILYFFTKEPNTA